MSANSKSYETLIIDELIKAGPGVGKKKSTESKNQLKKNKDKLNKEQPKQKNIKANKSFLLDFGYVESVGSVLL